MIVKKFHGSTVEEAEEKAKKSLGPSAIILMNKIIKKKGLFSSGQAIEVTAAVEEKGDQDVEKEGVVFSSPKEKSQDSLTYSSFQLLLQDTFLMNKVLVDFFLNQ